MKHKQNLFMIALAIFAGFIGGFISNQLFETKSAFAEEKDLFDQAAEELKKKGWKIVSKEQMEKARSIIVSKDTKGA